MEGGRGTWLAPSRKEFGMVVSSEIEDSSAYSYLRRRVWT